MGGVVTHYDVILLMLCVGIKLFPSYLLYVVNDLVFRFRVIHLYSLRLRLLTLLLGN